MTWLLIKQPSLNSNSSLLMNAEEMPGRSTPQSTTAKSVINVKYSALRAIDTNNTDTISINRNNVKRQTVRFKPEEHNDSRNTVTSTLSSAASSSEHISIITDNKTNDNNNNNNSTTSSSATGHNKHVISHMIHSLLCLHIMNSLQTSAINL